MASDLETRAKAAFIDDHFELAIGLYSQAIDLNPNNAELYADWAQANIELSNFTGELPKQSLDKASNVVITPGSQSSDESVVAAADTQLVNNSSNQVAMVLSSKPKYEYRHEFYQKPEEVVVTIFAKGVPAKNVEVDFGEQILSVIIHLPGQDPDIFQPRLFGKIIPQKCKFDVLSTKIEILLAKAEAIHWTSLEFSKEATVLQRINVPSGSRRGTYCYFKRRTVRWDNLEAQVKKEEKDEKIDGDAALNKFFRDIYQDADEDTRRAMRKSFVESNGTVLFHKWREVGSKKVEGTPPHGMELKKGGY